MVFRENILDLVEVNSHYMLLNPQMTFWVKFFSSIQFQTQLDQTYKEYHSLESFVNLKYQIKNIVRHDFLLPKNYSHQIHHYHQKRTQTIIYIPAYLFKVHNLRMPHIFSI